MKRTLTYLALTLLAGLALIAQPESRLNENQIQTLLNGINSENPGLKRSSIYFAGYYKIEAAVEELRSEMINSNDPNIKILAALALYEIGNEDVLSDIDLLSKSLEEDLRVRRMAKAIHDYWIENDQNFVSVAR